ncbi:hypothetical protein BDZ89DRAFT_1075627 [Hymenopellis radicata]|nr:hypothetical protein BDZ89DRAFT_1075627 [Hymenopellis radicata]
MSPPHLASQIPWTGLTEHIQFAPEPTSAEPRRPRPITGIGKPLPSPIKPDFEVRPTSDHAARQTATLDFARAFGSLIVEHADARTSLLPKPDVWHTSGLVNDEQLFPPSLISKMLWGHGAKALLLIIFALNYPENPYEYLPALLYLAQHPRVCFSESQDLRPLGRGLPGLGAYASQTIARYLFVNLVDVMSGFQGTKKRTLGFTQRQRAWHVAVADYDKTITDERLHLPFWISNPNAVYDATERQHYLQRSFDFMVSWYAIMREAAVRDWALGLTAVPAFGEKEFIKMVLDELELICSAFKVDEPPPIPVVPDPPTVDVVEVKDLKPSPFTALPLELHIQILSFLPRSALLSIIRVSQQMRTVCRPILYADPLSVVLPPLDSIDLRHSSTFDLALQNYMPRLVESLVANPSMSKFLRCLHVAVPALDFWGAEKASWLKDLLGDIWLQDVRELWVYPTYLTKPPSSTDPGPEQEYCHGVYELARLFPGLSTLHLIAVVRKTLLLDPVKERSLIATQLPRLEILILSVYKWSIRPRRIDYPVDDGFDEEQRQCAARFFETCKGLGVISFNGIPREDKKGKVPDRVWTRVDGGSGARMTVGGALKWRLSEEEADEAGGRV